MTTAALIHLIVIILFCLITAVCAVRGLSRGISMQAIRTAKMLTAALISIFTSRIVWNKVSAFFDGCTMEDIKAWLAEKIPSIDAAIVDNFDIETIRMIAAIPVALVFAPLAFMVSFLILNGLMTIVYHVVCGVSGLKGKKEKPILSKIFGLVLGALHGAVVTGLVLLPIIGASNYLGDAVATINESGTENAGTQKVNQIYYGYLGDTSDGPIANALGACGINKLYSVVATVDVGEEDIPMTTLIPDTAKIYVEASSLQGVNWKQLTPENKAALTSMVGTLKDSPQFKSISAGLVSGFSKTLKNGDFVNNMGTPMDSVMRSMMDVFSNTTKDTVAEDLDTMLSVYFVLSDGGVLLAMDGNSNGMLDALTAKDSAGDTNLNRVMNVIKANDRTKPLITLMTKLSISVMSEKLEIEGVNEEIYENVKTGLNETLQIKKDTFETEQEYVEAVSSSIDSTLKDNGIELEEEIVDKMAEYVSDNFSDIEEISDDEINDLILSYYDAYLASQSK